MADTDTVVIRRAVPADLAALRRLVERAYRGDSARQGWTHEADLLNDERTSDAELAAAFNDPGKRVLVAESAGALIGTVTITDLGWADDGQHRAYLGMLGVEPTLQAQRLGRTLLAAAEALAVADFGATLMEMTVIDARPDLAAWYQRRGYTDSGERRDLPVSFPVPFRMLVLVKALDRPPA